jgi:hypothetical protein
MSKQKAVSQPSKTKTKKGPLLSPEGFEKALQKRSPWYQSIMDPLNGGGAKIPDPSGYNTACYQYVRRVTVPVNAQGVAGLRILQPYTLDSAASSTAGAIGQYQATGPASSIANLAFGDGAVAGASLLFADLNAALSSGGNSLAQAIRPVSGAIMGTYTGTSLSDAGTFVSFSTPTYNPSSNSSDSYMRNLFGSSLMPVKANRAAIARLLPIDRSADVTAAGIVNLPGVDYRAFVIANRALGAQNPIDRGFGVYATGMTPSTGSVDFIVVLNFEFIPRFIAGGFISSEASPQDPMEENFVLSTLDVGDAAGSVTLRDFSQAPSASSVVKAEKKEDTGPLSAVTESVGFLGSILEVGLPLLAAIL